MEAVGIILLFLNLYSWILLARALLSWIPNMFPHNDTAMNIYRQVEPVVMMLTEPVLQPIRKLVPPVGGTIDVSIMIAFFGIIILRTALVSML